MAVSPALRRRQPKDKRRPRKSFSGAGTKIRGLPALSANSASMSMLSSPRKPRSRVGRASVCQALVRALDEWAAMREAGRPTTMVRPGKNWLKIARQADTDEWRNRFREALLRDDRSALENLADAVPIRQVCARDGLPPWICFARPGRGGEGHDRSPRSASAKPG